MESTDGLSRGLSVKALGRPISVPVGEQIKGRLLNVVGRPITDFQNSAAINSIPSTGKRPS